VWVSSTGVYHTALSPYRASIFPKHCFETVEDAAKAGYRPPKSLKPLIAE
jgi:methylphosphotriester-DNA--protein-cysteine methyltransferase